VREQLGKICYLTLEQPGFESTTLELLVEGPNHDTTRPHRDGKVSQNLQ